MPPKKTTAKKTVKKTTGKIPTPVTPEPVELTIEQIMELKTARIEKVMVQLDGEVAFKVEALQEELVIARQEDRRSNEPDQAPKIETQLQALLDGARLTETEFIFKSIGRPEFERLLGAHKPTAQQKKEGHTFNPDTFAPQLVAASSVKPLIRLAAAKEMFQSEDWNTAELTKIYVTAQNANTESPDIPLSSSAIGSITDSISSLIMQQIKGSRTQSS